MLTTTMIRILAVLESAPELSVPTLAAIAGVPATSLGEALRDRRYLGSEKEARIFATASRCAAILDAVKPLAIAKGDWQTLKSLYESARTPEQMQTAVATLFE